MTTWAEIAERARNASGGDRELDCLAHMLVNGGGQGRYPSPEAWTKAALAGWRNVPPYSTSVDAVLGLVAEKLKGVQVDLAIREDGTAAATIDVGARIEDLDSDPWKDGRGATPALALLAAFALAMQAEEGVQSVKEGAEA